MTDSCPTVPPRLLAFARAPRPGEAKTRLAPVLGMAGAARLHAALVRHTLIQAASARAFELQLWAAEEDPSGFLPALADETGAALHGQTGPDLGARMAHALTRATADGTPAIVIGTDCPWLDARALREAAAMLRDGDAVLGPANDGGYVLLGLHRVADSLFADIAWGTEGVAAATRARLAALGWYWRELDPRPDVDRPEDLDALARLGGEWPELIRPA